MQIFDRQVFSVLGIFEKLVRANFRFGRMCCTERSQYPMIVDTERKRTYDKLSI